MKSAVDLHAVIMAGGSGTRFWPLSRKRRPKQFLPIVSEKTMIEETYRRIRRIVPGRRVFTIADAPQSRIIRRLLPALPAANVLIEPRARNTAASLILATAHVHRRNPEAVVAVLASDHLILDEPLFLKKLEAAAEAAFRTEGLVTFGVQPTYPATGYGYIQFDRAGGRDFAGEPFYPVRAFREKPTREAAAAFLESGDYAWNSGMFLWRASVFARALERDSPAFFPFWQRTREALDKKSSKTLIRIFEEIPALSIDYALMEKAKGTLVCAGDFGWSDVGAWSALGEIWPRDDQGNARRGDVVAVESRGNIICNPGKLTALIGVENTVIVQAGDVLLVCRKDRDQDVKKVLDLLRGGGKTKHL
ncbi:MAG: mannose-1-phosphate guanylyltransferase [Acidobacteria bacterium]|jgi:Mannose-1-phosphate guanylyltransferase|nr:mannose-1-phosphate guanylyltransferase [Acidobacteriota bacterium]HNQ81358.1 sugar phosphate nucleotidyltransferase [Candidatus Aminicenantes bacterium]HNT31236.1 sugar phosphate nucleotidyltransferase [Candidatus Aminicenantes bacterium]HQJ41663.1 sugar phosphate nucleotidyltransferase [Candidatus Aminicenantes bacterium]